MKKLFPRLLALILVIAMLPISALATLDNHNTSDVTLVQSTNDNNYYFPDIVKLPDGTLVACYYTATQHVDHTGKAYGTCWLTESSDNGYTWSAGWKVVDRKGIDSRDPNLAVLPDGTLILTYMGGGVYMLMSEDGGHTWSETIELESQINNTALSKRGNIVAINNDNILIPCYGSGNGENPYGAPATATGRNEFGVGSWHADCVLLQYQRTIDNDWIRVDETQVAQESDETGVMYTGKGIMAENGIDFDGDVYCISREDGTLRVSHDSADTWEIVGKEEVRMWKHNTTSMTIMKPDQFIQPRAIKLTDDCFFVTYASYDSMDYAYDREVRPVFGKVFFPKEGWNATVSKLIYDELGSGVTDMADPATVLTAEGRLLTIYYNTSTKRIAGTFHDLEDWLTVDEDSTETKVEPRYFWRGALATGTSGEDPNYVDPQDSAFRFVGTSGGQWQWTDGGYIVSGQSQNMVSNETISDNYAVQFEFKLSGNSADSNEIDSDEGIFVYPLFESDNPNIDVDEESGEAYQYRLRLSATHGASVHYGTATYGDNGDVLAAGENNLPTTLKKDVLYSAKIQKQYDGLFFKVWEAAEGEPAWQFEYHDDSIGAVEDDPSDDAYSWKYQLSFNNVGSDNENMYLANMEFVNLVKLPWNFDGLFTKSTYSANTFSRSGFAQDAHAQWETDVNGFRVFKPSYMETAAISGDYDFRTEFTIHNETGYNESDGYNNKNNGMTIQPEFRGSGRPTYRLILSTDRGVEFGKSTVGSPGSWYDAGLVTNNNDNTTLEAGTTYMLAISRIQDTMKVKVWEKGTTEPEGWDFEVTDGEAIGGNYPFRMYYEERQHANIRDFMGFSMYDMQFNGISYLEEPFWKGTVSNELKTQEMFTINDAENWSRSPSGYSSLKSGAAIMTKNRLSGDYTYSMDFMLTGTSPKNRDAGFYIRPFYGTDNPNQDSDRHYYSIRMADDTGVQFIYGTNSAGDYSGVLGGKRGPGGDTLPQTLDLNVMYTFKMEKIGDTVRLKVWKVDDEEPDWQFTRTDDSIDVAGENYSWNIWMSPDHNNKASGQQRVFLSNGQFYRMAENTTLNSAKIKEDDRWFFWKADVANKAEMESIFTVGGPWNYSDEGMTTTGKRAAFVSDETISGHYTAKMNFILNDNGSANDGLVVHPLYESTNANNIKDYRIKLTADKGMQLFYETEDFGGSGDELVDTYTEDRPTELETGVEYTLKVTKFYDELAVKVWPADEEEPLGWSASLQDKTIGYKSRYVAGSHSYPYSHSLYGENDKSGTPYQWKFMVDVNDARVTITDLQFYKDVELTMGLTEWEIHVGDKPLNREMNVKAFPDIYSQLPKPERVQYSSANGCVELEPIQHNPQVRINRAWVTGVAEGKDTIIATMPDCYDSNGNPASVTSYVTVLPANNSAELKTEQDGYLTEILYQQDFEEMEVNQNVVFDKSGTENFKVVDASFNALSDFFEYQPFYAYSHQAIMQADMVGQNETGGSALIKDDNKYLQAYLASGSAQAIFSLRSWEPIEGDYTFQADVYIPSAAEIRVGLAGHLDWVKPAGENFYKLQTALTSYEKTVYSDYQIGFRSWIQRARLHNSVGIYMYDEAEAGVNQWQTIKISKCGDTIYSKSWPTGYEEPEWELIMTEKKIGKLEEDKGAGYLNIEVNTNNENRYEYNNSTAVRIDNILVTRKVKADAEMFNVNLVTNGGTIKEGKEVVSYIEGNGATLPTEKEITRTDYTFGGWYDNIGFAGEPVTEITTEDTGDKTFYAMWLDNLPGTPSDDPAPVVPETPEEPEQPEDPEIPEVPEVTGTITHASRSLSLEGSVLINQYVYIDGFEGIDIEENGGLLIFKDEVTEETATVENADYDQAGLTYDEEKGRYGQQSHGIAAKEYGDTVYMRAYVKDNNGNYHYGDVMTYSVREYAEGRLEKSSNQELKDACIAMLHYGAAAQTYYGYNTDNLANAGIAEQYPNFAWDASLLDEAASFTTNIPASKNVVVKNKSLSLEGAIEINFYSTVSNMEAEKVELLLWKGVAGQLTVNNVTEVKEAVLGEDGRYAATSMEYAAKEYGETVFACAKVTDTDGNEHYSEIVPYSPEVYAAGRLEKSSDANLKELVKAMTIYGEKARVYFG